MGGPLPKKKIVIICGPTGAGKTGFAIDLARRFGAEIIGADSMQIYRYMDIGTAKPTASEQAAAVHHLIDVVDPDEDFDAAAYATMATTIIKKVIARGNIPLVVGGTGFYIKALLYGLFERGGADETIREQLNQRAETEGSAALHRQLTRIDPASAARIHVNDTYRIVRALEVHAVTGEPLSVFQKRHGFCEPRFDALEIGLAWPRPVLYDRINRRVDAMMDQGFLEEVRQLLARGYHRHLKSMQSLGYRHLTGVVMGDLTMESAVTTLKRDHRRYAKRQLTWFHARPFVHWLYPTQADRAEKLIRAFFAEQRLSAPRQ
ncbi:MiaA: tRNA delta(2)-isopentenylpyrophosphate transferase [Desulfosarcina variabilis str. Montpellier]